MVYKPSVYLVSAAVALVTLQMDQVTSSSLAFDPFTTCNSYNIGDESFPGRGTEIPDDGNCVVTLPGPERAAHALSSFAHVCARHELAV